MLSPVDTEVCLLTECLHVCPRGVCTGLSCRMPCLEDCGFQLRGNWLIPLVHALIWRFGSGSFALLAGFSVQLFSDSFFCPAFKHSHSHFTNECNQSQWPRSHPDSHSPPLSYHTQANTHPGFSCAWLRFLCLALMIYCKHQRVGGSRDGWNSKLKDGKVQKGRKEWWREISWRKHNRIRKGAHLVVDGGKTKKERNSRATEDRKKLPLNGDYSFCGPRVQWDFTTSAFSRWWYNTQF